MELAKVYIRKWDLARAKNVLITLETTLKGEASGAIALGECLFELGEVHYNLQDSVKAMQYYTAALEAFQSNAQPDALSVAKAYYGLGNTYQSTGNFPAALQAFEQAEQRADSAGSGKSGLLSLIFQAHSAIYRAQGKLDLAFQAANKSIDLVANKTDRGSSQILADACESLGDVHMARKELQPAIETYERALSLKKVLYPSNHPETGKSMGKLGIGLVAGNKLQEALQLFKDKLAIDKAALGEGHLTVADDYHDVAFASVRLNQIDEAETAYEAELRILETTEQRDAKRLANAHLNLLSVKLNKKKIEEGLFHGQAGVELLKGLGQNREQLAFALGQVAELYLQKKDLLQARALAQESHKIRSELYPADHPEVGKSLVSLGQIMGMTKDPQAAEQLISQGVNILRLKLKRDDIGLGVALAKLGTAYASNRKLEPAITSFKEAVFIFRKALPLASGSTVTASLHLISLYMACKKPFDAENVYRRVIADIEQADKRKDFDFPRLVKSLHMVLKTQEKEAEAKELERKYEDLFRQTS
jgi:tetratricopeptide (TPR) repeat protein